MIMNVPKVMPNINQLKLIAKELMDKLQSLRDPKTGKLKREYKDFISFVSFIASLGLLRDRPNPKATRITQYFMHSFNNAKLQNDVSSVNSDPNRVNSGVNCANEDINSVNNDDIGLNENVNIWNQDLKQSPEFQRFYQNYKDNIRMADTYIEEAVQSFELVDNDNTQRILEQLHKFKNQVAGIMAIGMIFVGNNTNFEIPQADRAGAFDQIGENKCITEMSSEEPQADAPVENNQVGGNVSILDQLWGLSKYGPTVITVSMLILGADTTSFGFVSVLYRLVCYFSKKD
ncbi:cytochrome P450 12b1, mitochondrial-like [Drosophila willistoni]|uniref:cytochrome P450 12b1, mitochondrial-like n=1 Tax=Drosophila willistoni TaxID=7260 RepID=UPI001F087AA7|nr:cytochrome P450 12b1, mitochondrial-like [Drosophila willistoni]XP_046865498.1 cytochrome P450 12b1, mitochondrial-like [Drosophila willistoni]